MCLKWKEAATAIITGFRSQKNQSHFDYGVLGIKRSAKTSFMPGSYVFPGGAIDAADFDKRWLNVFSKFNVNLNVKLFNNVSPPILLDGKEDFPKVISLKIAAIRETFEETGILLCQKENLPNNTWVSSCCIEDLDKWRSRVQKDAHEFLNLCENCRCYPDVNNLHLWCNWLTPISKPKRFDTIFFICSLSELPESTTDESEVSEIRWCCPKEFLEENKKRNIILPPPQLYEISRLLNFNNCCDLITFAKERSSQGCERWMPQYIKLSDGVVGLLPGDDAYNADSFDGFNVPIPYVNMTLAEFHAKYKILHRLQGEKILIKNFKPGSGHVLPVC